MAKQPLSKEIRSPKIDNETLVNLDWGNLKDKNIYKLLMIKGPLTCPELSKETGLSPSTLFDVLNRLMLQGLIERFSDERQTKGRPRVFFCCI